MVNCTWCDGRVRPATGSGSWGRYRDLTTGRSRSGRWAVVFVGLTVAALIVCAVATVKAGWLTPVFFWPVPEGTDVVQTKQQYESSISAQGLGRVAAVVTLLCGLGATVFTYLSSRARRVR